MSKETGLELGKMLGEGITQEDAQLITEKIEGIVEARVDAKLEIEKELIESEVKEKYDTILFEKTEEFNSKVLSMEESFLEQSTKFKEELTVEAKETVDTFKQEKEQEMETFVEGIINKLDEYLELEVSKHISTDLIESSAKIAVLEPIVNGFKSVMEENYIKFDEDQFGLLKESRSEILNLREQLAESVESQMKMNKSFKSLEKDVKISKVCEGLTESQRERAIKLLEDCEVSEVETRFSMIRDMIISEDVSSKDDSLVLESDTEDHSVIESTIVDKVVVEDKSIDEDQEELVESAEDQPIDAIQEYASIFKKMR
tara:strand:- start:522 stop:1469 length:948 start_codon:yes stop_codon:yes gene_type:complete